MIDPANAEIIIQDSDCGKLKCSTMPAISIILPVGLDECFSIVGEWESVA